MKLKFYKGTGLFALVLLLSISLANGQLFKPDDNSSQVSFAIRNFGVVVNGTFKGLSGTFQFGSDNASLTHIDVTLDARTISTGIDMRDNHIKKKEYLDVSVYPRMRFVSTHVTVDKTGGRITGNLTIKDVTKEISFPFQYSIVDEATQFSGAFEINRRDFHVGGGSISMGDIVTVTLQIVIRK